MRSAIWLAYSLAPLGQVAVLYKYVTLRLNKTLKMACAVAELMQEHLRPKKGGRTWQDLNCQIVVLHVTMSCTVKKRIRKLIKHLRCIKVPRTSMYKRNQRYLLAAVCSIVWL